MQLCRQRPHGSLPGFDEHAQRRRGQLGDLRLIADGGQFDPPDATRPAGGLGLDDACGEPGLADASGAGQGHQPLAVEQRPHRGELGQPAHEAGELNGQVSHRRHGPAKSAIRRIGHPRLPISAIWPIFCPARPARLSQHKDLTT
jgi:hypothetical protein